MIELIELYGICLYMVMEELQILEYLESMDG